MVSLKLVQARIYIYMASHWHVKTKWHQVFLASHCIGQKAGYNRSMVSPFIRPEAFYKTLYYHHHKWHYGTAGNHVHFARLRDVMLINYQEICLWGNSHRDARERGGERERDPSQAHTHRLRAEGAKVWRGVNVYWRTSLSSQKGILSMFHHCSAWPSRLCGRNRPGLGLNHRTDVISSVAATFIYNHDEESTTINPIGPVI